MSDLHERALKMASAIHFVCDETVADDVSATLKKLVDENRDLKKKARDFLQALKNDDSIHDWSHCLSERDVERRKKLGNPLIEIPCIFATFEQEIEQ